MRVFATVPISVTQIGDKMNDIAKNIARNPQIEKVIGSDFIVYLTYSYDESDRLGWVVSSSSFLGIYQGTQKDADEELMISLTTRSMFGGSTWYETKEEALKAQEEWEAEITTADFSEASRAADGDLLTYGTDFAPRKKWYQFWL